MSEPAPAPSVLLLHPDDNVVVAVRNLTPGCTANPPHRDLTLTEAIPAGHKLARHIIDLGAPVIKYGQIIGHATRPISAGAWVHSHNLAAGPFHRDPALARNVPPDPTPIQGRTFLGFRRPDGRAATRNYLAILSSVNCSASVSRAVAARFTAETLRNYPNIDGIIALTHKSGCGLQYQGADHHQLARTLAGFANHPNVHARFLIGLGCETATLDFLQNQIGPSPQATTFVMQDLGGTTRTIEAATRHIASLLPQLNDVHRSPIPAAELVLGTNCGGSDGYSGITANPALGVASDLLIACGGTSVLAETPEIYGAEHLLTRRARTPDIARKLLERVTWWEHHVARFGVQLANNPSPGNKAGGLTTIYEKSLGAVAKGGSTALTDVIPYAEPIRSRGLVFMDTPGFDPVSVTGLIAGGCHLIAFTTGRGSCFGSKPAPTLKIATHSALFERMRDDMDFDAGRVLRGTPLYETGRQLFELILEVAGSRRTRSEVMGLGDEEFAPWHLGPTL